MARLLLLLLACILAVSFTRASDLSCTLCEVVFNEVEGMLAENLTEAEISAILEKDICPRLPSLARDMCGLLADKFLPFIIERLEQHALPGDACSEFKLCDSVPPPHNDPDAVQTFIIDLDASPQQRFSEVCGNAAYVPDIEQAVTWLKSWIPTDIFERINKLGEDISKYLPYPFADEISGCAVACGMPVGDLMLLNIAYELTDACTSIVAQNPSGLNFHVRNLDFGLLAATTLLRNVSVRLNFTRGGSTLYSAGSFVGYVGILSAVKGEVLSLSLNTRMMSHPIMQLFDIYVSALEQRGYSLISFLSRSAVENSTSFSDALTLLSETKLIADVYYIIAEGVNGGRGCVLARNATSVVNSTCIAPPSKWFVVQTNYDWWGPVPWYDDRMVPATQMMQDIGQGGLSFSSLFELLSTRPVLNQMTAFSAFALPINGTFEVLQRWCNDPCPF